MKGVAIVGASQRNIFAVNVVDNLRRNNFPGPIWPVNPKYSELFGVPCYPSLADLPGEAQVVLVAVSTEQCRGVIAAAVAAGIPEIIVITDGFAEAGRGDLQAELIAEVEGSGSVMYGPNCLGMFDVTAGLCAMTAPVPYNMVPGSVSVVSQSGAALSTFMDASVQDGFGLDWCLSLGNGAQVDMATGVKIALERPTTRVVCVYAESLGIDPADFAAALDRAQELGKWVLILKAGVSQLSSRIALSHTASLAGEDNLVGSFLQRHGAVRVDSLEELVRLAGICSILPEKPSGGVVVVGTSGGTAVMSGDAAARYGMRLAKFTDETMKFIREKATPESFVENPFDLVRFSEIEGGANTIWQRVYQDPNVSLVVAPWPGIYPDPDSGIVGWGLEMITDFKDMAEEHKIPTVGCSLAIQSWTPFAERLRDSRSEEYLFVRGLDTTLRALARIFPEQITESDHGEHAAEANINAGLLSEEEARDILDSVGLPLVKGQTFAKVGDIDVSDLAFPLVAKIAAEGVNHKASIGGVRLGLLSADSAVEAAQDIIDAVTAAGVASPDIQGVRFEEMIRGTELLLGLQTDPGLGKHLTIGIGGSLAEAADVTRTVMLPVSRNEIVDILEALKLWRALGKQADAVAGLVLSITEKFFDGDLADLRTLELNPVIVTSAGPRIADVLIVR